MLNILFINTNLHGHINPTLPLVKELVDRGNRVDYYCSRQFAEKVTATGAAFLDDSAELEPFLASYRSTDRHPFYMLMEYILQYTEAMLPGVLKQIHANPYNLIICDSLFGGPLFLKQLLQIPIVSSHSSFAVSRAPVPPTMLERGSHVQLDHCYEIVERIGTSYGIAVPGLDDIFVSKADWNVVYTIPEFNGDQGLDAARYLFTGPVIPKDTEAGFEGFASNSQPVVYISLGSMNTDYIGFYKMCMGAFEGSDYNIVMSIGQKCDGKQLGEIPSNFYVANFVPQLAVLKQTDVFITHAGFNSVSEALYYEVPLFALPLVNDQHMVAKRIREMELGLVGKFQEITPQVLRDGVEWLLGDKQIKENCRRMSTWMREGARLTDVAESLEDLSRGHR